LADGLAACGITTVALESTGLDGLPRFERLETRGFEVRLVDPPQVQKITGRPKSDVHDCQWRPRLHPFGVLASAFRPTDQVCVLRSDLRQRALWLSDASQHIQPRHKALTPMHIKRQHVVSDVTGATGMAIMRAMRAGARDPVTWARRRHDRGQHEEATIAKALRGQWRDEPRLALAQAVALYDRYHQKLGACDRQSDAHLGTFAERPARDVGLPVVRPRKRTRHRPPFAGRGSWPRMTGVDRTAIAGLDEPTALTISREIGLDRGRWPTVKHCTSWLGRCPHHRVSGGQV
jgi:transposase